MDTNTPITDFPAAPMAKDSAGIQINFKRVIAGLIRFWYLIILSLLAALVTAYLINRYTTRIYPVKASIIIKENDENVGAKFLYDNELLNPYRNFYNEIFIMKSYPLLQEVLESLGFDVSIFREGEILTSEYYDPDFPVEFHVLPGSRSLYGASFYFRIIDETSFSLEYSTDDQIVGKNFQNIYFNDSISINGFAINVTRKPRASLDGVMGKRFTVRFNNPLNLAKQYSSRLSATWAQQGAAVVDLEVTGPVPQKEVDFLNRFIERYQHYDVEKKNRAATMAMGFLDDQLVLIGDSLKLYEDQVENFKKRNITTNLKGETDRLFQKLQEYEEQKFQYKLAENYYSYVIELLNSDQYDGVFTPSSVGITDNIVANLISELMALQAEVSIYKSNKVTGVEKLMENPRLIAKEQRISFLKADIQKAIENSRKTQQINTQFISSQIKIVEEHLAKLPRTERELVSIQRNYSLKENLYVFLLQKRTEAGLSKASTTSDIVVVNPPMASGPITPKVMQNFVIAGALGLMIPFLALVFREVINDRVQSKEDIEKLTNVPVIGGVGHNASLDPLIVYRKPRSAMAESFRALRSNLNYFTGSKERLVFMVTSSIPGEGKSFTTLNVATVLAMAGKRTLILGADLRKPKLFDDLKLNNTVGLSQYLSGMASLQDVIQASEIENLFLIPGGPMPPNPSELLIRPIMAELISELRKQFDYVVIDTPPLSYVTDAFVLSQYADHTLFVVRQDYTPRGAFLAIEDFYSSGRLAQVSILFNDLRKMGLGYGYGYGYNYGYGYSYRYGYYGKSKNGTSEGYYSE